MPRSPYRRLLKPTGLLMQHDATGADAADVNLLMAYVQPWTVAG